MTSFNWSLFLKDTKTGKQIKNYHRESACFASLPSYKYRMNEHFSEEDSTLLLSLKDNNEAYQLLYNSLVKTIVPDYVEYNLRISSNLTSHTEEVEAYTSFLFSKMRGILNRSVADIFDTGLRVSCRLPKTNLLQTLISFRYIEEHSYTNIIRRWYTLVYEYNTDPSLAFVLAHSSNSLQSSTINIDLSSGHTLLLPNHLSKSGVYKWCTSKRAPLDRNVKSFIKDNRYKIHEYWQHLSTHRHVSFSNFVNGTRYDQIHQLQEEYLNDAKYK